ncbi:MAG: hypothetical protein L0I76_23080 [Pseudonocardia sp.]|nr:hypothetical protein [Pseudonocardia sp.]
MIGGKVLDASYLAALVRGRPAAWAWLDTARAVGIVLALPSLALTEVRAVRPDGGPVLAELLGHPAVLLTDLDAAVAADVDDQLTHAAMFDALAGHVVHLVRHRGWPALTDDPGRLHRLDPDLEVDRL